MNIDKQVISNKFEVIIDNDINDIDILLTLLLLNNFNEMDAFRLQCLRIEPQQMVIIQSLFFNRF